MNSSRKASPHSLLSTSFSSSNNDLLHREKTFLELSIFDLERAGYVVISGIGVKE